MKIFVAGSKSQYDEVMEIVKRIVNESEVNYVTPGDITAKHMVHSAFQKISECNLVIALQNPDGALEEDVSYKVEFAKWLKKPIVFISKNNNVLSLAHAKNVGEDINKGRDDALEIYTYYQYDNYYDDKVIGIVMAKNEKEAEKKVQEYYKKSYHDEFTKDGWDIKKADFCTDECCEIYYGG